MPDQTPLPNRPARVATWSQLKEKVPSYALVTEVDLVVVRFGEEVSVLYGRCLHRGALLADGHVEGENLICGVHNWDFRIDTGVSEYDNRRSSTSFGPGWTRAEDAVLVDSEEVEAWAKDNPQPFEPGRIPGPLPGSPRWARRAAERLDPGPCPVWVGSLYHGAITPWGAARRAAVLVRAPHPHRPAFPAPLFDAEEVGTGVVIGPRARRPLKLDIPLFVSDISFRIPSEEAKIAFAMGAERAGTGICSGEGGMLPEEQAGELQVLLRTGVRPLWVESGEGETVPSFSFQGRPGRETGHGGAPAREQGHGEDRRSSGACPGTGGHKPVQVPPPLHPCDFREVAEEVREATGGIPIGFKLSAQHIENDLDFALEAGLTTSFWMAGVGRLARLQDFQEKHRCADHSCTGPSPGPPGRSGARTSPWSSPADSARNRTS